MIKLRHHVAHGGRRYRLSRRKGSPGLSPHRYIWWQQRISRKEVRELTTLRRSSPCLTSFKFASLPKAGFVIRPSTAFEERMRVPVLDQQGWWLPANTVGATPRCRINRRASPRPAAGTSPGREPTSQGGPTQKGYAAGPDRTLPVCRCRGGCLCAGLRDPASAFRGSRGALHFGVVCRRSGCLVSAQPSQRGHRRRLRVVAPVSRAH
jgi:hypothetical protein